jgi:mono/diheme cytochrome c family protein
MMQPRRPLSSKKAARALLMIAILAFALTACDNMRDQPRYDPLEPSTFFADQRSVRLSVPGTVPQGAADQSQEYFTGRTSEELLLEEMPVQATVEMMERGQERYNIYCAPCHGIDGYGEGMIVQRGFPPPQSLHTDRLRGAPDGHFYDVITNGFGRMFDYSYRIQPDDRWAIVAYIRAMQLSQFASEQDVPADQRQQLEGTTP